MHMLAMLVVLANGTLSIPAREYKAIGVNATEHGTTLMGSFTVRDNDSRMQAVLVDLVDAERFHQGRAIRPLYVSGFRNGARILHTIREAGQYVLLLDNRLQTRGNAEVDVRFELTTPNSIQVRTLSDKQRHTVVALSLLFFGAVVVFSARQFLKG